MRPVFLIGFMGSGKTTLGRALHGAELPCGARLSFIDLDEAVEQAAGLSIPDIFAQKGETYFRELETATLHRLATKQEIVVACGGGTPCHSGNMEWMNTHGLTVLLQASEQTLLRRLAEGAAQRPLLAGLDHDALRKFVTDKQAERMPHYSKAALTFPSDLLENAQEIERSKQAFISLIETHIV